MGIHDFTDIFVGRGTTSRGSFVIFGTTMISNHDTKAACKTMGMGITTQHSTMAHKQSQ
jgi:hypothetical protein